MVSFCILYTNKIVTLSICMRSKRSPMKETGILLTTIALLATMTTGAFAATDGVYTLSESAYTWDGTDADRYKATSNDYNYDYGDEASLSYTLPWPFIYYGRIYTTITVDANGNIWFGYAGSAYSFILPTTGKGPVIAGLNNDLTSLYYGGIFIQHKTGPERVVIEWQAETYSDEGTSNLNDFEVVLFSDGAIRSDYKTFNATTNRDFGSGISKDDGAHFLSLTANYDIAYSLSGRSFTFTPNPPVLTILFPGSGSGTISSTPSGIACNTNCSASFPLGAAVTLHPAAAQYSLFSGWTNGTCTGTGDCLLTMLADASVTAVFNYDSTHQVQVGDGSTGTFYASIQAAYNASADNSTIKLWATNYAEQLDFARQITVILQGGYDVGYNSIIGDIIVDGSLTITDGTMIADGLVIK